MAQPTRERLQRVAQELGLHSLFLASADVKLLCLQRFVRLFAYGASTLMLASFLQSLDISKTRIGLFMTLTLVGDVCISFFLTLIADGLGRKSVLATGAALMIASGAIFATAGNYWILLAAAVLGVISPSGNEIGPFRAIEESVVAHLTAPENRSDIYAWYSLGGTAGTAFGMVSCGWLIHWLSNSLSWDLLEAYRAVFIGYAALGAVKLLLALALSGAVEAKPKQAARPAETAPLLDGETPLMDDDTSAGDPPTKPPSYWKSLLPEISRESAAVIVQLCLLFTLDSFASGLAPLSWLTFYFRTRYSIEEGRLGSVFFVTSIISSASMIVASSLAKRFGNVKTMVFTHLPSALFLALIPIPNNVYASLTFLILRACTQSMDTAPRSAFLAAIVLPAERTAVMGTVNVVKTTAQSLGPLITGLLADRGLFWVSFVAAGSLKATYDLGLLAVFKNHEGDRARREELAV